MAVETVPYVGFNNGEYGNQAPFNVGFAIFRQHLMYRGWFTGTNVARSIDGSLFPQPWPKKVTTTGLPAGDPDAMGIGYDLNGFPCIWLVYKTSGDIYLSGILPPSLFGSITFSRIATAALPAKNVLDSVASGDSIYLATDDGVWRIAVGGLAASRLTTQKCSTVAVYGDRLVVAGGASTAFGNRVYYSAGADFTSWDGSYIEIGETSVAVTKLLPIRGALAIAKQSAADSPWWMLRGVPGLNDVLRPVNAVPAPMLRGDTGVACALRDGTVGFFVDSLAGQPNTYPALFNGSTVTPVRYLAGKMLNAFTTALALQQPGDWALWNGRTFMARRDGAWTVHDLTSFSFSALVASDAINDDIYLWRPSDSSIYVMTGYPERPAFASDLGAVAPATASLTLPEWWSRDGSEVAVKAVIVDFLSWNTGDSANPNTFTPTAVAMRTYDPTADFSGTGGGDKTSTPNRPYSEAGAGLSTAGTRRRVTFTYTKQFGNGFRLDLADLRGVSIQKIVAVLETKPAPGV